MIAASVARFFLRFDVASTLLQPTQLLINAQTGQMKYFFKWTITPINLELAHRW